MFRSRHHHRPASWRRGVPGRRARARAGGFTLMEMMIVIVLIGLVMAASVRGLRAVGKSELRSSATRMAGAIRYLFDRASTTGKIHRLAIDLEQGRYWAEVSDDRFWMPHAKETEESRQREAEALAAENEEKEKERKKREEALAAGGGESAGAAYDLTRYQPQEFRPKRAEFSSFREVAIKPVELPASVKLVSLFTPRLAEPVTEGKGYIYFFPMGLTEAALVHLSDPSGQAVYTLVVHPLSGRVRAENADIEPPVAEQFDDEGKRIDPGAPL